MGRLRWWPGILDSVQTCFDTVRETYRSKTCAKFIQDPWTGEEKAGSWNYIYIDSTWWIHNLHIILYRFYIDIYIYMYSTMISMGFLPGEPWRVRGEWRWSHRCKAWDAPSDIPCHGKVKLNQSYMFIYIYINSHCVYIYIYTVTDKCHVWHKSGMVYNN